MESYVVAAAVMAAGGGAGLLWAATAGVASPARRVRANLRRGLIEPEPAGKVRREGWSGPGRLLAHPAVVGRVDRLLAGAGRPAAWPMERVLSVKVLAAVLGLGIGGLLLLRGLSGPVVVFTLVLGAAGFFLPDLLLYNTGLKRRQVIAVELPDVLDQMSIAVEAGLGFDAAMVRVARNSKGVLAAELIRTLQDIQVGRPRRDAFTSLAQRCRVPELRRFIRAVIQAEEYGIALSQVLGVQAREMRIARRQRAERKAMQIPVKVSFPLILTILPALLLVIMGPAAIGIMQAFQQ